MAVLPSQETGGPAMEAAGSQVSSHTSNVAALVLNTVLYSVRTPGLHATNDCTKWERGSQPRRLILLLSSFFLALRHMLSSAVRVAD